MASELQQFYDGLVVFITGGSGFLGKLLLLKLLQSCPDFGGIIMLLREKRGQSCRERLFSILSSPVSVTCVSLPIEAPIILSFLFLGTDYDKINRWGGFESLLIYRICEVHKSLD